jgi:thiol-disulfide isomerase/thioredoxin
MEKIVQISSQDHLEQLLDTSQLLVLEFYTDWCCSCKDVVLPLENIAGKNPRVTFAAVNCDRQREVAAFYKICTFPTFLILQKERILHSIVGFGPDDQSLLETLIKV